MYICQLSQEQQAYIKRSISRKLYQLGYKGLKHKEILQNGMDGKLCDLTDTIDMSKYYKKFGRGKMDKYLLKFYKGVLPDKEPPIISFVADVENCQDIEFVRMAICKHYGLFSNIPEYIKKID